MSVTAGPSQAPTASPPRAGRLRRSIVGSIGLVVLGVAMVVGILTVAPTSVGGPASYVITEGTSMLPTYEAGGVVITHERADYAVGDVVGYRNPDLRGLVVLHRIIDVDGDRFVMQGDNNDFLDDYRPTRSEVVGEAWIYLPGAGQALLWTRQPLVFGGLIAILTLVALRSSAPTGGRRARLRRRVR